MSDLKYKSVEELEQEKKDCNKYIQKLSSSLAGQNERLKWINQYIFEKTPQELSMRDIEKRLGHRVIIKGE